MTKRLPSARTIQLFVWVVCFFCICHTAPAQEYKRIIVRNVKMVDLAKEEQERIVQILIEDKKLNLVTEDPIPRQENDLVLDAEEGVLMGKLEPDVLASFMILSEDPRSDFKVLLDTNRYAVFALYHGDIQRNKLAVLDETASGEKVKESGWLAYIPPSMAVPTNYLDSSRWNRWEHKYISGMITGALALDRTSWLSQSGGSTGLYGDLNDSEGGEIRALRLGVMGTLNFSTPWVYTFTIASNTFDKGFETEDLDTIVLYDYRIDIPSSKNTTISIGKQKEPISMERLMNMIFEPMQERSAVSDALLPSRNVGLVWSGRDAETYSTWAVGFFNDWLDTSKAFNETASQIIGRFTWVPFVSDDESNLLHLGVGYRYSEGKEGFQFATEPEMNKLPLFVDTGFNDADRIDTLNLELSWRKGPFWLASEYMRSKVDNDILDDPSFDGFHITASWILTGEMRRYNKKNGTFSNVPVAKATDHGGIGAWEISGRYSYLDLDDGGIDGGNMQIASLGLNWWVSPVFCINMNYRHIESERDGISGRTDGVVTRVLVMLE